VQIYPDDLQKWTFPLLMAFRNELTEQWRKLGRSQRSIRYKKQGTQMSIKWWDQTQDAVIKVTLSNISEITTEICLPSGCFRVGFGSARKFIRGRTETLGGERPKHYTRRPYDDTTGHFPERSMARSGFCTNPPSCHWTGSITANVFFGAVNRLIHA
jgi:hypothetical protein